LRGDSLPESAPDIRDRRKKDSTQKQGLDAWGGSFKELFLLNRFSPAAQSYVSFSNLVKDNALVAVILAASVFYRNMVSATLLGWSWPMSAQLFRPWTGRSVAGPRNFYDPNIQVRLVCGTCLS
jgi:hypothetical protein